MAITQTEARSTSTVDQNNMRFTRGLFYNVNKTEDIPKGAFKIVIDSVPDL
jgi:hypothetical protein